MKRAPLIIATLLAMGMSNPIGAQTHYFRYGTGGAPAAPAPGGGTDEPSVGDLTAAFSNTSSRTLRTNAPYENAVDVSGGIAPYSFFLSHPVPGLDINASGVVSGAPTTPGTYSIDVVVEDSASPPDMVATGPVSVSVLGTPSATISAVTRRIGRPLSLAINTQNLLNVTYEVGDGALPSGTSITLGTIDGIPLAGAVGRHQGTVVLRDGRDEASVNAPFDITLLAALEPSALSPIAGQVNNAITPIQVGSGNALGPVTFENVGATRLTSVGLSLSSSGLITGTPSAGGEFDTVIRMKESLDGIEYAADITVPVNVSAMAAMVGRPDSITYNGTFRPGSITTDAQRIEALWDENNSTYLQIGTGNAGADVLTLTWNSNQPINCLDFRTVAATGDGFVANIEVLDASGTVIHTDVHSGGTGGPRIRNFANPNGNVRSIRYRKMHSYGFNIYKLRAGSQDGVSCVSAP